MFTVVYSVSSYSLVVTLADIKTRRVITESANLKQGFRLVCTYYIFHEHFAVLFCSKFFCCSFLVLILHLRKNCSFSN